MPEGHCCDLRVKQRVGNLAAEIVNDLEVLSASVENLENLLVVHEQIEQRLEIDALGLRVDGSRFIATCDLDQAKVRPVCVLAHELGVHGDERLARELLDEGLEVFGL